MSAYNSGLRLCCDLNFWRNMSFSLRAACEASKLDRIEASAPDTKVNEKTPITMRMMQKIRSAVVLPEMSPKPTVEIVVMIK